MNEIIKTVKNGALAVHIREYSGDRFGFDYRPPGEERVRVRKHTVEAAEKDAERLLGIAHAGKVRRDDIDDSRWLKFERWERQQRIGIPVSKLVPEFLESRKQKGTLSVTIDDLRGTLTHFAKAFPGNINDLQRNAVEKWLNSRKVGNRRWNNMLAAIVALHRYARRDGIVPVELTPVERIDKRKVVVKVETYSADELEKLIAAVPAEWLPFIIFGAFCGIRPYEVSADMRKSARWKSGLCWDHVNWAKRKVDVPAEVAKDGRRRFVPMCDAALEFLADWRKAKGPVCPAKYVYYETTKWATAAEVPWKNDGLRHSYASYRLALTHDMAALALEMGNSATMIHRHYLDLKHEDEATAWFAIRPKTPANLLKMTA